MTSQHRVLLAVAACTISACATAPPPVAVRTLPVVKYEAVLQPGCLLPDPDLLSKSPRRAVGLLIRVDISGKVEGVSISESAGNEAVNDALASALMQCQFTPAFSAGGTPYARSDIPDVRFMRITWPQASAMVGVHRCVRPEYPHAIRRAEEVGMVLAQYRKSSQNGKVEVELLPGSQHLRMLRPLTLSAVAKCLDHASVAASIQADKWVRVGFDWQLE